MALLVQRWPTGAWQYGQATFSSGAVVGLALGRMNRTGSSSGMVSAAASSATHPSTFESQMASRWARSCSDWRS